MPWQECSKVDERLRFVAQVDKARSHCGWIRNGSCGRFLRLLVRPWHRVVLLGVHRSVCCGPHRPVIAFHFPRRTNTESVSRGSMIGSRLASTFPEKAGQYTQKDAHRGTRRRAGGSLRDRHRRSISRAAEKQIERELAHRYGIDDPQFRRELGTLLGPAIIDGNRVENLENGVEIFPAMLAAIRGAQADHQLRDLHLLVRARSAASSPTRWPSARAPASRCTC